MLQAAPPKNPIFISLKKIALIHDWFITGGGSEKVVREILHLLRNEQVDVFTLMDFLPEEDRRYFLHGKRTHTSFLQRMPLAAKNYRYYLPLFPPAIEQFDLHEYDVVISSSHSVAKGVKLREGQVHLCYCHTPMRYLWDMRKKYISDHKLNRGWRKWITRPVLSAIRKWDYDTSARVSWFIANSENIRDRIRRNYKREAEVVYPPVDTEFYQLHLPKEDFYVTASRMVPYKKVQLIVEAFSEMPGKRLVVIGDGPEYGKIKALSKGHAIEIIRFDTTEVLRYYLQRAKAFVFAAEEDFGITPVEAQACGTPVIAYGKGGALETVIDGKTGIYFHQQSIKSIIDAVYRFENLEQPFDPLACRAHALQFSKEIFYEGFSAALKKHTGIVCSS
jgi:glycosyltransferase involved in cell wall biosynthesis